MAAPKLRFNNFNEDWIYKKGNELFCILGGAAFKSEDSCNNGAKWLKIANVGFNEINNKDINYLPEKFLENYSKYILYKGDIVIALTRPILNSKLKIALIDDKFNKSLLNQRVGKIIENNLIDKKFLYYILQLESNIRYLENKIAGTDPPNLSNNDLLTNKYNIPILEEQQKISNFLSIVDKKIESQENIITHLESTKKGLMQKIFSQEIRFKDDNGKDFNKWEVRKIDKLGNFYNGLSSKSKDDFENGNKKYITYMNVFKNTIGDINAVEYVKMKENEKQNRVQYGDVLFTQSSETIEEVGMSSVWLYNEECYLNSFCFGFRFNSLNSINPVFIAYLLRSEMIRKAIILQGQGSTRMNLTSGRLGKVMIPIPELKEQEKIANFLSKMDEKIESEKNILGYWKNIKKGLLQQMFV